MRLDIDLGQLDPSLTLADDPLEHRPELPTGPAPRRPEVDDHGHRSRALDHPLTEVGLTDVGDHGRRAARVASP